MLLLIHCYRFDQYEVLYNGNAEVIGNFRALNFYKSSDINIKEDIRLLIEGKYILEWFVSNWVP